MNENFHMALPVWRLRYCLGHSHDLSNQRNSDRYNIAHANVGRLSWLIYNRLARQKIIDVGDKTMSLAFYSYEIRV